MRHFILTSPKFTGQVSYKYSDDGYLILFLFEAVMNEQQRDYLLQRMPLTIFGFNELVGSSKLVKVEEVKVDLSFDSFWNTYPEKRNRHRCEPLWDKMSDKAKLQCLQSLEPYRRYVQRKNIANKLPEGYLKNKEWLNDFDKLK